MDFTTITDQRFEQLQVKHNVIVNEGKALPYNDNVNKSATKTETGVNAIAERLIKELNNPGSRDFYCLVGWRLSEATIQKNLDIAKRSNRSPQRYFTWLCNRSMEKQR